MPLGKKLNSSKIGAHELFEEKRLSVLAQRLQKSLDNL
jgi:hypothetical protein